MMRLAAIPVFLMALSFCAPAQTLNIHGVDFSLGETEARARADIAAAEIELQKFQAEYLLTVKRGDAHDLLGQISFKNGKVEWIGREWYVEGIANDKNDLAQVFSSAVTSLLAGNASALCNIIVRTVDRSPSSGVSKSTTIICHQGNYKHLLVLDGTDCSGGCSIGPVSAALTEILRPERAE